MGFDDGPDPLLLGFFETFRGEAQPGGQPLLAPNPLAELVVGFHPSTLITVPAAVQQTGRLMAGFCAYAPRPPFPRVGVPRLDQAASLEVVESLPGEARPRDPRARAAAT